MQVVAFLHQRLRGEHSLPIPHPISFLHVPFTLHLTARCLGSGRLYSFCDVRKQYTFNGDDVSFVFPAFNRMMPQDKKHHCVLAALSVIHPWNVAKVSLASWQPDKIQFSEHD